MSTFSHNKPLHTILVGSAALSVIGGILLARALINELKELGRVDIFGAPEGAMLFGRCEPSLEDGAPEGGVAYV